MLFSIIVATYNAGEMLLRCVNSIKRQKCTDYELVLVDDGSDDNSLTLIENAINNINCEIIRIQNSGVSTARNTGLENAKGDYVVFVDADDELTEDCLEEYKKAILIDPEIDILVSGFTKCYPRKRQPFELNKNERELLYTTEVKEFYPFHSRIIGTVWGKCYKKELFANERFDKELTLCEDAELNYRVFPKTRKIKYINKNLYNYYYSLDSTVRLHDKDKIPMYCKSVERIVADVDGEPYEKDAYEFSATVLNVICYNNIYALESGKDREELLKHVCEDTIFDSVLSNVDLNRLSFGHRTSIRLLKKKAYKTISVINKVKRISDFLRY
jgi:glycosyltransferase involved in cell wall biosynthesis